MNITQLDCGYPKCVNHTEAIDVYTPKAKLEGSSDILEGKTIKFSCQKPYKTFRQAPDTSLGMINYTCKYNSTARESQWVWNHGSESLRKLPNCEVYCSEDPPSYPNGSRNWNGSKWKGSLATYSCGGKHLAFDLVIRHHH